MRFKRQLEKAETDTGSFLEYAYDSEGMLKEVTDHAGRKVKLEYDGDMLKTVTTPSGAVYTYSYGDNGRITETVNARNVTAVRNRYDSLFRVIHQEFPDGGTMEMIVKTKGEAGGPLEQFSTVGYKYEGAAKRLYEERMVRIESTSAYSATDPAN